MANPTDASGESFPLVLNATTSEASITLDPDKTYTVAHNAKTNGGVDATETIYCSDEASITATAAEGANKLILYYTRSAIIGPGVNTLYFVTAANSATFTLAPSKKEMGIW